MLAAPKRGVYEIMRQWRLNGATEVKETKLQSSRILGNAVALEAQLRMMSLSEGGGGGGGGEWRPAETNFLVPT